MKQGSTLFLKLAIMFIGISVLGLCLFVSYSLAHNPVNPDYANIIYPILTGIYVSAIPFYIALYRAFRLLSYIDKNKAFSQISVNALKHIEHCATAISILYVLIMPFFYLLAQKDDAPGLIIIATVPTFAAIVIAVFAAVLQRLLQEAIDLKSENDLTV